MRPSVPIGGTLAAATVALTLRCAALYGDNTAQAAPVDSLVRCSLNDLRPRRSRA